mgnify:CR=1 FL=1
MGVSAGFGDSSTKHSIGSSSFTASVLSITTGGSHTSNIGALTFIHRNGKIQSFYVSVGWREGGIPEIKGFGSNDLEEIRLTEKGLPHPANSVLLLLSRY